MSQSFEQFYLDGATTYADLDSTEMTDIPSRETLLTGINKIDKLFSFPAGYYVICANPGAGKGWFATWLSRQFYRYNQKKTIYFSLEMAEPLVRQRLLQQWSDLTQKQYQNNAPTDRAIAALQEDCLRVDIFFSDETREQTPENFKRKFEYYYALGFRIFHFDHLHELEGANSNNSNQEVTDRWARTFQQLCKDYEDAWLFIYAQPNGTAATKPLITRTDIAGSKAITQKCEFFISLNRSKPPEDIEDAQEDRKVVVYLDKTRLTSRSHIGFSLYFAETGNFYDFTGQTQ